jgi:hypothetical protein
MKTLFTIIIVSINLTAISQSNYLGLKGGVNWCDQSGNFFKNTEAIQRFSFGLDYGFKFKNNLKIGGNILFSQTGFKDPLIFTDELGNPIDRDPVYTEFRYDYLSIPIKVGYEYGNKGFIYGNIGIATSLLLSSKTSTPIFNENFEEVGRNEYDASDNVTPIEFGGIIEVGFGYTFFEKLGVYVEGNFHHGFTSVSTDDYFTGKTILNYRASANLGIRYKLNTHNSK